MLILLNVYCAVECSKFREELGYKLTGEFDTALLVLLVCGIPVAIAEAYEPSITNLFT